MACQAPSERNFHIFYQVSPRRGPQLPRCSVEKGPCLSTQPNSPAPPCFLPPVRPAFSTATPLTPQTRDHTHAALAPQLPGQSQAWRCACLLFPSEGPWGWACFHMGNAHLQTEAVLGTAAASTNRTRPSLNLAPSIRPGVPEAWTGSLCSQIGTRGSPDRVRVSSCRSPISEWGFFAPSGDSQNCLLLLSHFARLWLPSGASGSGMVAVGPCPPKPMQAWASPDPRLSHTRPPPQIYKGAHAEERVRWCLPEGATFSPGCPTQRGPWKVGGACPAFPGLAQQHPHIPPGPAALADLGS